MSCRTLALVMIFTAGSEAASAQPARPERSQSLSEAQIRTLTRNAQSAARGDKDEFVLGLDARVRERWGDFESFPISLVKRDDLRVTLSSPYMTYRRTLIEYLRINRPPTDVPWIDAIVIAVEPLRIDAPDVARVIVERDGIGVLPTANQLRPMKFTNGSGVENTLHAGEVRFPLSAFALGGVATIRVVVQTGEPFVTTMEGSELATLK